MENWSTFFFLTGFLMEGMGVWLFLRKKDGFFEPIIGGFLCFLVGFLAETEEIGGGGRLRSTGALPPRPF